MPNLRAINPDAFGCIFPTLPSLLLDFRPFCKSERLYKVTVLFSGFQVPSGVAVLVYLWLIECFRRAEQRATTVVSQFSFTGGKVLCVQICPSFEFPETLLRKQLLE
jgi:hypothetical protein